MIWSSKPIEFYDVASPHIGLLRPLEAPELAVWNLQWLFNYEAFALLDGTLGGITEHFTHRNAEVTAAINSDVSDDVYGIKQLATSCRPSEFMEKMMRRPFKQTSLYLIAGADVWKQARTSAEKLEVGLAKVAIAAQEEAMQVIQTAKILPFRKRA